MIRAGSSTFRHKPARCRFPTSPFRKGRDDPGAARPIAGAYDYSAFTQAGEPRVLRFWLKEPNDPPSPGRWKLVPEEYAIGFAGDYRNTNGGVALGYGYNRDGTF